MCLAQASPFQNNSKENATAAGSCTSAGPDAPQYPISPSLWQGRWSGAELLLLQPRGNGRRLLVLLSAPQSCWRDQLHRGHPCSHPSTQGCSLLHLLASRVTCLGPGQSFTKMLRITARGMGELKRAGPEGEAGVPC